MREALRIVHVDEDLAVVDKPRAWLSTRRPRTRGQPWSASWATCSVEAPIPSAPESSTASTRGPAACSSSPVLTRPMRRSRLRSSAERSNASIWPLPAVASPRRAGTIERADRPRLAAAPPHGGLWRRLSPGAHSFPRARTAQRRDLPRGAPRDRPNAQIRAHFAAISHPLAGDTTYGGERRSGLERQFLHAHRLAFTHPRSGEPIGFESALPADLAAALSVARDA